MGIFSAEMRLALADLDIPRLRAMWIEIYPQMKQPATDKDALILAHATRTACTGIHAKARAFSHAWLRERGLPSLLPDHLKQSAERLYPVKVGVVGISVKSATEGCEAGLEVRTAMENVVKDHYANGDTDDALVSKNMQAARTAIRKKLYGRWA